MNGTQAVPAGGRGGLPDAASLLLDLTAPLSPTLVLGSPATAWWDRLRAERAGVATGPRPSWAAVVMFWSTRPHRRPGQRVVGVFAAALIRRKGA